VVFGAGGLKKSGGYRQYTSYANQTDPKGEILFGSHNLRKHIYSPENIKHCGKVGIG
jgi:hypothetical protein